MSKQLLDDPAMQDFIREGYVRLHSTLPSDYHARMYTALEPLDEGGPRGHNNLLPCVPELGRLLDDPPVAGALESILGPGYFLHFHRHDHVNLPDAAQPLHKDGDNHSHHAVDGYRRMHRTRYAMLFYYPQDTPLEKGPTGIVPRSQYLPRMDVEEVRRAWGKHLATLYAEVERRFAARPIDSAEARNAYAEGQRELRRQHPDLAARLDDVDRPWERAKIPLDGPAGSVTIVHFDTVHGRFSGNETDSPRHMVKFLFTRAEEPTAPSWHNTHSAWPTSDATLDPVWASTWHWHRGHSDPVRASADVPPGHDEASRIATAYTRGHAGETDALCADFFGDDIAARTMASYGLIASGDASITALRKALASADIATKVRILDVLEDIGPVAVDALDDLIQSASDADPDVRRYALEALGTVGQARTHGAMASIARTLAHALDDDDAITRRNAALASARLGTRLPTDGTGLVAALEANLYHWHHHVRGWAIEALGRLPDPAAQRAALSYLMAARWDPAPKSGDRNTDPRRPLLESRPARHA